jgi:hypothetical protein
MARSGKQLRPRRAATWALAVPVRRRGVTRSESDARPAHTACVASVARSRRHTSLPSKPLLTASSALLYLSVSEHASRALLLCPALHSQPGSSHLRMVDAW